MEFNTGLPPAGEAGMLLMEERGSLYFKYWTGALFGASCLSARAAWEYRESDMTAPVSWRFATIAEITAAGIPESEARGMVHKSMLPDAPWYPPQQEGFGPWVEHTPGFDRPVADGVIVACLYDDERETQKFCLIDDQAEFWPWTEWHIVAYCVKLEDKPAIAATCAPPDGAWRDWHEGDTVPSVDRVDVIRTEAGAKGSTLKQIDNVVTTSQYWGPSSFVRKWRPAVAKPVIADPNSKMIDRDSSGVVSCVRERHDIDWPSFDHAAIVAAGRDYAKRQHDKRVAAAAWVERPRDHRLGNF